MTTYRDFDSEYQERPHSHDQGAHDESAPGVYVRGDQEHELPGELDMLWSGAKTLHKEERSPFIPFGLGFLLGAALSAAVCWLLFIRPHVEMQPNDMTTPVNMMKNESGPSAAPADNNRPAAAVLGNTASYKVMPGDTLGKISLKMYGSTEPKFLQKIQRANNMKNPNSLKLDQVLTIPPKEY
jgi:hypothetical protein